jgi:hypothetical protein
MRVERYDKGMDGLRIPREGYSDSDKDIGVFHCGKKVYI